MGVFREGRREVGAVIPWRSSST